MTADRRSFFRKALVAARRLLTLPSRQGKPNRFRPQSASDRGRRAYVYGYSLITTEVTRVQGTNIAKAEPNKLGAPMNNSRMCRATRRRTTAVCPRPTPTRCTRWLGSTSRNRWCSATRIWATAFICSRWSTCG